MFYHINGKVTDIEPSLAVIDCAGVGYALSVSVNTLSHLQIGESVKLFTYENVREDAFDLFGFFDKQEKRCFEMLLGVSGVGPKAAISILSAVTPEALAMAVISGDEKALTAAQGIGKKIAQRILLELKDKMSKGTSGFDLRGNAVSTLPLGGSKISDAVSALAVLGYSSSEITMAMKDIDVDNTELEGIIKQALRKMLK